jgi:hypothetical protein
MALLTTVIEECVGVGSALGLVAQRVLALPRGVHGDGIGLTIALTITTNTILGALLAGLVASGTESVVRTHPRSRTGACAAGGQIEFSTPVQRPRWLKPGWPERR